MPSGLAVSRRGNPATMGRMEPRAGAVVGVLAAAVLASFLVVPAVGQLATWKTAWLAVLILGGPTLAVLVASGYRHYGLARSIVVAAVIVVIAEVVTWVVSVFAVAAALSGSGTSLVLTIVLYAIPAMAVAALGLLALTVLPSRTASEHPFEHSGGG